MKRSFIKTVPCILVFACVLNIRAQNVPDSRQEIESLGRQAQEYLQQKKPGLAIPVLREILELDPNDVNARGNLGVLLFFQEKYPEAITEMRIALQAQPTLWKIEALLGIAEKRSGDLAAAQTDLATSFPHLDEVGIQKQAGLELIELISATGELDQAAAVAARLETIAPQDPQILFVSYQISLQMVDRTLISMTIAAPDSAELHMMMADQLVLLGDGDNAIAQYREAIRINPQLPGVHFELAVQLKESSNPALTVQAEHEFRTAVTLNRFDEKAWRGLGEVMADKGNLPAAKEDYTKALALFPKDSDAETDLAKLLVKEGDAAAATSLLESAVKDDPTNIAAHYQLSSLYRQAGRATESQQEMDQFTHYKALKDELGTVFRQFRQQEDPAKSSAQPATR